MHVVGSDVAPAYLLAQQFTEMVRERRADAFGSWLEAASTSGVTELTSFSASLRRDHKAIVAALSTGWSNGQTEGQVNRLKLLKRQMFGRVHHDLLRRRVLGAA